VRFDTKYGQSKKLYKYYSHLKLLFNVTKNVLIRLGLDRSPLFWQIKKIEPLYKSLVLQWTDYYQQINLNMIPYLIIQIKWMFIIGLAAFRARLNVVFSFPKSPWSNRI